MSSYTAIYWDTQLYTHKYSYILVYTAIYLHILICTRTYSYGEENEKNAILYWVYTDLYSVQINIYRYTTLYPSMNLVYLGIYAYEQVKIVYTLMNAVYLRSSPCIRVYTRMWHFAKTFMTFRFESGISCILQGCSDHYATSVDTIGCIIWYMCTKLRFEIAHHDHLLADVGRQVRCWAGSTPAPAMMCGFAKRGFKFKPPGPALPGCQWVPCDPGLSQAAIEAMSPSHYAQSGSARSLRP